LRAFRRTNRGESRRAMHDYRRYRVPGGAYFFIVNLLERRTDLLVRPIEALREAVGRARAERPFHIDGWGVPPDHVHCVLTLPPGDDDFSNRIKALKIRCVRDVAPHERRSSVRVARGERGIWQRRFWEHAIRDQSDYARHMDYLHFNPVKHGYVNRPWRVPPARTMKTAVTPWPVPSPCLSRKRERGF
jgi:putative transposase